ncbi:MAG: hypothetical protein KAR20_30000 [Candidatus Heimdallarchaeota archaeon]|nr:hypothetical protein [Candidatus Heimdallarchaeota archaeon]
MSKMYMGRGKCHLCGQKENKLFRDDELYFGKKFCKECFDFLFHTISSAGCVVILAKRMRNLEKMALVAVLHSIRELQNSGENESLNSAQALADFAIKAVE